MVLLRMFLDFEVEVFKGFETWFLQSFYTSECFWIFFDAASALNVLVCRNALGRLLFIGVWGWISDTWWSLIGDMCHNLIGGALRLFHHDSGIFWLAKMSWFSRWHMSAPDWTTYVIAYMHRCVIGFRTLFMLLFQRHLAKFLLISE